MLRFFEVVYTGYPATRPPARHHYTDAIQNKAYSLPNRTYRIAARAYRLAPCRRKPPRKKRRLPQAVSKRKPPRKNLPPPPPVTLPTTEFVVHYTFCSNPSIPTTGLDAIYFNAFCPIGPRTRRTCLPYRMHHLGSRMALNGENRSQLDGGFRTNTIYVSPLFYEALMKECPKMPPIPGETLFSP